MAGNTEKSTKAAERASAPFRAADHLRTEVEIAAYIESMLADGDVRAEPIALRTVADVATALDSPVWHGDALQQTAQRCEAQQEQSVDWDAAKQELRQHRK
jgi:hypothetical protein